MTEYSVWLVPKYPVPYKTLLLKMFELGNKYDGPAFEPHLTVAGGLNISKEDAVGVAEAVSHAAPCFLEITGAGHSEEYFKAIYLEAERNEKLLAAYAKARSCAGMKSDNNYAPHISLFYRYLEQSKRQGIVDKIGFEFPMYIKFDMVSLWAIDEKIQNERERIKSWQHVEDFQLV